MNIFHIAWLLFWRISLRFSELLLGQKLCAFVCVCVCLNFVFHEEFSCASSQRWTETFHELWLVSDPKRIQLTYLFLFDWWGTRWFFTNCQQHRRTSDLKWWNQSQDLPLISALFLQTAKGYQGALYGAWLRVVDVQWLCIEQTEEKWEIWGKS